MRVRSLSIQGGLTFDPAADWTLGLTVLYAEHDEDVFVGGGTDDYKDGVGLEIDLFAEYRYSDQTTVSGGLGVFFPDEGAPFKNEDFNSSNSYASSDEDDIFFLFYVQARIVF